MSWKEATDFIKFSRETVPPGLKIHPSLILNRALKSDRPTLNPCSCTEWLLAKDKFFTHLKCSPIKMKRIMILLPLRLLGSTKTLLNEPKAGTQQPPVSIRVMMMVAVEDQT